MNKIFTRLVSLALLLLATCGLQAASITYSLTTHIDGRTITGTANVNSGASLENGMPRALWRANTTYTYYSDAELTQEITVAPAENAMVYVDYVFEPPFFVSSEGVEYYYYFNAYISSTKYFLCDDLGAVKSNSSYRNHALWALYGDGYCVNLKAKQTGQWLTYNTSAPVIADAPMTTGWQLYESSFTNNGKVYGTVVLGTTNNDNQILHYDNNATPPSSSGIPSSQHAMGRFVLENITNTGWSGIGWDNHHKLHNTSSNYNTLMLSNSSFFFTVGTSLNIYSTVWRILKANGTWNPDIVVQKGTSETQIGMPTGQNKYTEKAYCTYDRYYKDADFTEKYADDYMIPVTGNTVIYVKERYKRAEDFQKGKWITLTIPYNIGVGNGDNKDFETWFGAPDPVKVLELYHYELDGNKYNLKFQYVNKIEASKPYLFKPVNVPDLGQMCLAMNDQDPQEAWINETVVSGIERGGADVTMRGTYEGVTLTYDADEIQNKVYAFLAYNKSGDMNFYRISEKRTSFDITPYRCYFTFTDPSGAGKLQILNLSLTEDGATAIAQVERDEEQSMTGTYDLMGRKVDAKNLHRGIYVTNGRKVVK